MCIRDRVKNPVAVSRRVPVISVCFLKKSVIGTPERKININIFIREGNHAFLR